jgi:RNA polymerase sigma-70 factor (ECF subfamily)
MPVGRAMMTESELAELIGRAQGRDPEAFDRIIDAYGPRLFGYLYRLTGSREDAEDLLQETFLRVVRMIADYAHDGRFDAWIFRIATNLARDRGRRASRGPRLVGLDDGQGDAAWVADQDAGRRHPADGMSLSEEVDALQQALARLSAAEREVVMLRHFSQLTFAEVSEVMGTPLGTTLARGHRALGKLREWMGATGEAVAPSVP